MNLRRIADQITSEADAYAYLESLRWPTGVAPCLHCGSDRTQVMRPRNGVSRKTRTGAMSERRVWQCSDCRKQFSVLTGTVMHGTKIPVRTWVMVYFEMACSKNGVAAREIERKYGLHSRSAWFLMHRIREAMKANPVTESMSGIVLADETYVGGSDSNRHVKERWVNNPDSQGGKKKPAPGYRKAVVLSLIDASSGEVRSKVIPDVTGHTLRKAISEQVDLRRTVLYTDEAGGYKTLEWELLAHETVNHDQEQYVRYDGGMTITTNRLEGFFSQLKRSVDGTHHHVSTTHLPRYLAEFDFRYTTKGMSDAARMAVMVGRSEGRRLTYKRITD